jgi:hypothetical protein
MSVSPRRCLLLASVVLAAAPAAAGASAPQPLVDVAPLATSFHDRVTSGASSRAARAANATAAQDGRTAGYATKDGQTIAVTFSSAYRVDPAVAQTYVDYLGSLPHGSELSKLRVYLAPPAEVQQLCGGEEGTLACYSSSSNVMTIPGEQTDQSTGVTTSYVVAHEYGHHVATFRSNAPWPAVAYGPKYWASQERVCALSSQGLLVPGDEGERYLDNPGEGWADTYAHIVYPDVGWQFAELMRPDALAFAAALRDVRAPWTTNATKTFTGTFTTKQKTKTYRFAVTLDGALSLTLKGPARSNFDLRLTSGEQVVSTTRAVGSRDTIRLDAGCRDMPSETLTVTVTRRSGRGAFSVKASYPG